MFDFEQLKASATPIVMGILNVTPDSFFDGGKYVNEKAVLCRAEQILQEGAKIIDIGGYSTRPNGVEVSAEEELRRLGSNIENILKFFPQTVMSVDTFRADVADVLIRNYGVDIINDISCGNIDKNIFNVVAKHDVAYVLMHMRGTPLTMQNPENTLYKDVTMDVFGELQEKIQQLKSLGVSKIMVDPGYGFAKTIEQNYELLRNQRKFESFGFPILAGMSRKSMLWKVLDNDPKDCLNATTVVNTMALMNGAKILRVHDVRQAMECICIYNKYVGIC